MHKVIKAIGQGLIIGFIFLIGLVLFILLSPIIIGVSIRGYFESKAFNKEYGEFLLRLEGKIFFCYNNRNNSKSFIESNVLPLLPPRTEIIFLDGKIPRSGYPQKFISSALYNIKDRQGFPYLLKISNGLVIEKSLNNEFYNTMNQNKDIEKFIEKIDLFFKERAMLILNFLLIVHSLMNYFYL